MTITALQQKLDERIANYDLLSHPFYKAWSAGALTREDLIEYGRDYYHHVAAFPSYVAECLKRVTDPKIAVALRANMEDENGFTRSGQPQRAHADIWLDFVEGMGGSRDLNGHNAIPEIRALIEHFFRVAQDGKVEEALSAFYAYESQVPRIAQEKARGLREYYGADEKTCAYFRLHMAADVYHSQVWRSLLEHRVLQDSTAAATALDAAEITAQTLWQALDGVEERRQARCMIGKTMCGPPLLKVA